MVDDWDLFDDGWRYCERCGSGFTDWEERIGAKPPKDCGYHEDAEEVLCEECWAEEEEKAR